MRKIFLTISVIAVLISCNKTNTNDASKASSDTAETKEEIQNDPIAEMLSLNLLTIHMVFRILRIQIMTISYTTVFNLLYLNQQDGKI